MNPQQNVKASAVSQASSQSPKTEAFNKITSLFRHAAVGFRFQPVSLFLLADLQQPGFIVENRKGVVTASNYLCTSYLENTCLLQTRYVSNF